MGTFMGYLRENGDVGVRNQIAVIPSVFCANHVVKKVAERFGRAVAFPHPDGCGQHGKDLQQTIDTLRGIGQNANFGAVLVVGLGCERIKSDELAEAIGVTGKPTAHFTIQDAGGTAKAIEKGRAIVAEFDELLAKQERVPCDIAELKLGLKCGGTDATSGIASNPALGLAVDKIVAQGGTAFLSEMAELLGTENIFRRRSETPEVYERICSELKTVEGVLERLTQGIERTSAQAALVTPGNFAGGVSSVSEKALGGIHKSGSGKFVDVIGYGIRPEKHGLQLMAAAGGDCDIVTALAAGGAQIVAFTTGRGTPTGFPGVPVYKITGNDNTFRNMGDDIDFNAGRVMTGEITLEQAGQEIYDDLIRIAEGEKTKAEAGEHDELFGIGRWECY